MQYLKQPVSYLITKDADETMTIDKKTIYIVPLWKWLAEWERIIKPG